MFSLGGVDKISGMINEQYEIHSAQNFRRDNDPMCFKGINTKCSGTEKLRRNARSLEVTAKYSQLYTTCLSVVLFYPSHDLSLPARNNVILVRNLKQQKCNTRLPILYSDVTEMWMLWWMCSHNIWEDKNLKNQMDNKILKKNGVSIWEKMRIT